MIPEPLKGKLPGFEPNSYTKEQIKSAVEGLIKFHEDRIEELIYKLETIKIGIKDNQLTWGQSDEMWSEINFHFESIMAIEHWLEDVIS